MKTPTLAELRTRYRQMSPEEFENLDTVNLTDIALTAYNEEKSRRNSSEWQTDQNRKDERKIDTSENNQASTSSTLKIPSGYLSRHWHGQLPLWQSFLVNTVLLLPLVYFGGTRFLAYLSIDSSPYSGIFQRCFFFAAFCTLWVWAVVGMWRSGSRSKDAGGWWITRWFSRLIVLVMGLVLIPAYSATSRSVQRYVAMAADADVYGQQGYDVVVENNTLIIKGAMAWGLVERFSEAIYNNPQVEVVVLDSLGGHGKVAWRIADQIDELGLSTLTRTTCESACTIAFIVGKRRFLEPNARLGFHSPSAIYTENPMASIYLGWVAERMESYYKQAGVSEEFLQKVRKTSSENMWYPSIDEMLKENIITDVVK